MGLVQIVKFQKSDLSVSEMVSSLLSNSAGMTVSHLADSSLTIAHELPFVIEGVEHAIPHIDEPEFCLVVRKRVDFTATGPNGTAIVNDGYDLGEYEDKDIIPKRPQELPSGFREVYRK